MGRVKVKAKGIRKYQTIILVIAMGYLLIALDWAQKCINKQLSSLLFWDLYQNNI